ncbi:catenin delta-1-like, partial [Lethenteron reissneri]|uniref:catenin delta-1-like n=1 Tax=Lethenteron reissneri TaxID=7753 RepID=UPI002AB7C045
NLTSGGGVVWAAGKLRSIFTLLVECEEDDHVLASACEMLQVLSSSHAGALAFSNNGSLAALASLLGRTHNPQALEKITSTLWNLSCHESLRAALVELCLPALVEHVLVPESGWRSNFGDSPASTSPTRLVRLAFRGVLQRLDVPTGVELGRSGRTAEHVEGRGAGGLRAALRPLGTERTQHRDQGGGGCSLCPAPAERPHAAQRAALRRLKAGGGQLGGSCQPQLHPEDRHTVFLSALLRAVTRPTPAGWELLYQADTVSCYVSLLQQSHNVLVLQAATRSIYTLASGDTQWSALSRTAVAHNGGLPCLLEQLRSGRSRRSGDDERRLLAYTSVHALRVLARNDPNNQRLIGLHNGVRILTAMLPDAAEAGGGGGGGDGGDGGEASWLGEEGLSAVLWALTALVSGSVANAQRLHRGGGIRRIVAIRTSRTACSQDLFAARALLTVLWAHHDLRASYKKCGGWDKEHFLSPRCHEQQQRRRQQQQHVHSLWHQWQLCQQWQLWQQWRQSQL